MERLYHQFQSQKPGLIKKSNKLNSVIFPLDEIQADIISDKQSDSETDNETIESFHYDTQEIVNKMSKLYKKDLLFIIKADSGQFYLFPLYI